MAGNGRPRDDRRVSTSHAGKLLVASPALDDPNFARTVVLLCMHDAGGAMGVVVNRPLLENRLEDHLDRFIEFAHLVSGPPVVFQGGPVETAAAVVLVQYQEALAVEPPNLVVGRTGLLDLSEPMDRVAPFIERLRVFAGYAGWGAGQLEQEIKEEAWFVVEAEPGDGFTPDPDGLWRSVLRRQAGRLAMFAYAPFDPQVN